MSIFDPGDIDMEGAYHQTGQCVSARCHACAIERRKMSEPIMIDAGDVTVSKIELLACVRTATRMRRLTKSFLTCGIWAKRQVYFVAVQAAVRNTQIGCAKDYLQRIAKALRSETYGEG